MSYVIAYDIGTTGVKSCLYRIEEKLEFVAGGYEGYGLYILENGGAEQDTEEWWSAMCTSTKELFAKTWVRPEEVEGITFCSQMQGLILVDKDGNALRRPMSYMDQRAGEVMRLEQGHFIKIAGLNLCKLLPSLIQTCAAPTSVKDPIWKYKWVEKYEPEVFAKIHYWLDVKDYLIGRCTGNFMMTPDSAYSTFLYDSRRGKERISKKLCKIYGVKPEHLPPIKAATDRFGGLTAEAAAQLGLAEGTAVYGGGGDATLIGIGAGCAEHGRTHIYSGTSGWVSTVIDKQVVDIDAMIAGIMGVERGHYNYFAEMETAGKCFEWVKEHLALDEIDIYLEKKNVVDSDETMYTSLYDYLTETVKKAAPGAGGVIFTPWLHGNRCPFEAPDVKGMFFNIGIETGKTEMIRAVLEGICYHLCWMLECQDKKVETSQTIRFVGGGALSDVMCQILADVTGRVIETIEDPQDAGAAGAALVAGIGLGEFCYKDIPKLVPASATYYPQEENREVYCKNYKAFKQLYKNNKRTFEMLNAFGKN